jgi:hypothetical protein
MTADDTEIGLDRSTYNQQVQCSIGALVTEISHRIITTSMYKGFPIYLFIYLFIYGVYILTCIPIAGQRVGKNIPATHAHSTIGRLLLGNGALHTLFNYRRRCFPWGPPQGYLTRISHS